MLLLLGLLGSGSALATPPTVAVTPPAALSSPTGVGVLFTSASVSGFLSTDDVRVVLGVDSGVLELTSGASGVTVPTGYPAVGAAAAAVAFEGTQAQVNSALGAVEWIPASVGTATLSFSATLGGAIYDVANGHYYRSVDNGSPLSWSTALTDAAALSFNGYTGYLATITSQAENDFLAQTTGAASWIGASEDSAYGAPGSGAHTGNYTWVTGPEQGTVFWTSSLCSTGLQGICAGTGGYSDFNTGEPNDAGGAEHYLEFNYPVNSGRWNDLANASASVSQYLVEFGSPLETPTDQASTSQSFTSFTVPDAPTSVTSLAGNRQATVSFTPAGNGGSTVTGYDVHSTSHGTIDVAGTSSPIIVSGLTNGSTYTFDVVAHNAAGDSLGSTTTVVEPVGPPDPPTGAAAVRGDTQATVSFVAPSNNGGDAISSYTVTSFPGGLTATGSGSPLVVHGLTNGTAYTFEVTAASDLGIGIASTDSSPATPAGPPGAPSGLTVVGGSNHVRVSFPAPSANGSAITSYLVTAAPGGGTCSPVLPATSCDITGLANGTVYTFTATATNAVATGAVSAPSGGVIPAGLPGQPTAVSAVAGDASALISFTVPASANGSIIVSYTVTVEPGGARFTSGTSPIGVDGLKNGVAYTFTVTATNGIGPGVPSDSSAAITPLATEAAIPPSTPTSADLRLAVTVKTSGLSNQNLVYRFTISNVGPAAATSVVLKTKLLSGVAPLVSAPGCIDTGHLVCALGSLAPGRSTVATIVVRTTRRGRYRNQAVASATQWDPAPANNGLLTSTLVLP